MTPAEYRALLKQNGVKPPRDEPEHRLQVDCVGWLRAWLRPEIQWIGGAAGLRLTPRVRERAAAIGALRPGWPDLSFIDERGFAAIELKAESSLSAAQRTFCDFCHRAGHRWALCRSPVQVAETVIEWGLCLPEARA